MSRVCHACVPSESEAACGQVGLLWKHLGEARMELGEATEAAEALKRSLDILTEARFSLPKFPK